MGSARIHVRSQVLRANKDAVARGEVPQPPILIVTDEGVKYAQNVSIEGPSMVVHKSDEHGGPSVWIECEASDIHPFTTMDDVDLTEEDCGCD